MDAYSRWRPLQEVEGGVVIQTLLGGPSLGHGRKFRVGKFPQPARYRLEPEVSLVGEHHGNVRRPVLPGALNRNGVGYPAVGEGMSIYVIKPARCQGHRGRRAEGGKDPLVAGMEVNGFTGMAVSQHDEKARRRLLQGLDRKGNVIFEDVIHRSEEHTSELQSPMYL